MKPTYIPCRSNGYETDCLVTIEDLNETGSEVALYAHPRAALTPEQATALAVVLNAAATEAKHLNSITPLIEQLAAQTEIPEATIVAWDQAQAGNRTGTHPLAGEIK